MAKRNTILEMGGSGTFLGHASEAQARKLAGMFVDNFEQYADVASEEIKAAGPKAS